MWQGKASSGVGLLVHRSLESRVSSARDGLVWMVLRGDGRRIFDDRSGLWKLRGWESRRDGDAI